MKKLILLSIMLLPVLLSAKLDFSFESGPAYCGYNDIQIPGDTGTEYSFCDDLDYSPQLYARMHIGWEINQKHYVFATLAPFKVKAEGSLDKNLNFDDQWFLADNKLTSYYVFNSWRLTWRYTLKNSPKFKFAAGFTAKIRDAYISVEDQYKEAKFSNVGFVPIIHIMADYKFTDKLGVNLTADALAAPQGRAEDARLSIYYQLMDDLALDLGYRILEGGADNDKIYGFALFHYLSLGLKYKL